MAKKWLKKLKPSAKPFAKLSKANTQIIKRAVPKSLQKPAMRASNVLLNSNVIKTSVETINAQASGGGVQAGRAALRRYHFNTFLPFDKRTKDLRDAEVMIKSGNPETVQAGYALRERVDGATARHGRVGSAVGTLFVGGGVAGGAVKAAASAVRANPTPADAPHDPVDTWPDPSLVPDAQGQMYRRSPVGVPDHRRKSPGGGLLSFLYGVLVPEKKRGKQIEVGASVPGQSGRYGGINPGGRFNSGVVYTAGPGGLKKVY